MCVCMYIYIYIYNCVSACIALFFKSFNISMSGLSVDELSLLHTGALEQELLST